MLHVKMEEIEVKILDVNRAEVKKKLIELGAEKVFDGELSASYFDFPDMSIRKSKGLLRLRTEGEKIILNFKERISDEKVKIRKEHEVEVSSFETTKTILEKLGFPQWLEFKKRRISYKLGTVKIEFDKYLDAYDFIPEFLEIEATNEEDIFKYAKILGFKEEDCSTKGFLAIADFYKKKLS